MFLPQTLLKHVLNTMFQTFALQTLSLPTFVKQHWYNKPFKNIFNTFLKCFQCKRLGGFAV